MAERDPARGDASKRATNLSLDGVLLDTAKALGIDIPWACERGLTLQIAEARSLCWLEENRQAIESSNAFVERHGLPLARYRLF